MVETGGSVTGPHAGCRNHLNRELGRCTGELRTASVVAADDCIVERVSQKAVARMERDDPDLTLARSGR